jgi:hypothetical protein
VQLYGRSSDLLMVKRQRVRKGTTLFALAAWLFTIGLGLFVSNGSGAFGNANPLGRFFLNELVVVPPAPASKTVQLEAIETTIEQLHEAGVAVFVPSYLPEGLSLKSVKKQQAQGQATTPHTDIEMMFSGRPTHSQTEPSFVLLWQRKLEGPTQVHISSDSVIKSFDIHGNPAVYYDPGAANGQPGSDSLKILTVIAGQHKFELNGNVGFEELVKVAESLVASSSLTK